jgi:cyclopropane-fatty-acyl-phospholipid synthase
MTIDSTSSPISGAARAGREPVAIAPGAPASVRGVLRLLRSIRHGVLDLHTPDGEHHRFGTPAPGVPHAVCVVHDWSAFAAVLREGDIGFGEAYMAGAWSTPALADLLRLMLANREAVERAIYGPWWGALAHRIVHLLRRNTRSGSRRNIEAHYDLGNAFYRLWLDPSMNYSSAWFDGDPTRPLEEAQHAKVRRALAQAGVRPGARVLEIGCGWGAVAESAVVDDEASIVGVTLSKEQLAWAQSRVAKAGPGAAARADLRLQDYRDIDDAPFDAIVSIEMFEAVGREYWPSYFRTVRRLLAPGGRACIQAITIRDDLFDRYAKSTDFIQRHIFPGGMLPSRAAFEAEAARAGLRVVERFSFGRDYAETLRRWHLRFDAQAPEVRAQGFDERFLRMWRFYMAYCEAAFDAGTTDVVQFTLQAA